MDSLKLITTAKDNMKLSYVMKNDMPWFKAKEIAKLLEYKNTKEAIRDHVRNKYKKPISEIGGEAFSYPDQKHTIMINEYGLHQLILSSKQPIAIKYQDWVYEEVLPSIRKTGSYQMKKDYTVMPSKFILNNERDYRIKLITYLRKRREDDIPHLIINGSCGELLKGSNYDIRREATMTGYEKGSADIEILTPNKHYNGCIIELKYGDNTLSNEQKERIKTYKLNGYKTIVSNEWTDLQRKIDDYLRDIRVPCEFCSCKFKNKKTLSNHLIHFHRHTKAMIEYKQGI